jgi:hypothetical protein
MSTANTDTRIRARTRTYELLLLMQTLAVLIVLWSIEPIYHAIMLNPGHQIRVLPESAIPLVAALILFQCVYWFRLLRVPVAMYRHSLVLSHFVLFIGRLSFIFGTSFFALLVYRHLPSLVAIPQPARLAARFFTSLTVLFSLYCYSSELDRLGVALRPPPKT